jgi:hypothetical protein
MTTTKNVVNTITNTAQNTTDGPAGPRVGCCLSPSVMTADTNPHAGRLSGRPVNLTG